MNAEKIYDLHLMLLRVNGKTKKEKAFINFQNQAEITIQTSL